jgi:hypothetical protein
MDHSRHLKINTYRNRIGKRRFLSQHLMLRYQNYAATIKILITKAKADYFNSELIRHNGETKKTWKCMNDYLYGKQPNNTSSIDTLVVDGVAITDRYNIANNFNEYFSSIGETTAASGNHCPPLDTNIVGPSSAIDTHLNIPLPTSTDIIKIIDKLKDSYHIGHDGLSNHFIKYFKF